MFFEVLRRLSSDFTIHWVGIGNKAPLKLLEGIYLHSCNLHGGDIYGGYQAHDLAHETGAKVILLLNDLWMLKNYSSSLISANSAYQVAAYVPLDGNIHCNAVFGDLEFLRAIYAYTPKTEKQLRKKFSAGHELRFNHFAHGINRTQFHPLPNQQDVKQQIFGNCAKTNTVFILNANRINERKDLGVGIQAFSDLPHVQKQRSFLVMDVPNSHPIKMDELRSVIARYQLANKIIINPLGNGYLTDDDLNKLYCACDIGVNTSLGEGWGMINFEHAATGAAQLVPDHSAPSELWPKSLRINTKESVKLSTSALEMKRVDSTDLTDKLIKLLSSNQELKSAKQKSLAVANNRAYDWDEIADRWKDELTELIDCY